MRYKLLVLLIFLSITSFGQKDQHYKRSSSSQAIDINLGIGQLVEITDTVPFLYRVNHALTIGQTMRYALAHNYAVSEALVSGTTIKTVNGSSVLGSGNLTVTAVVDTTTAGTGLVNKTRMSHLSSYPTLNQNTTGTAGNISLSSTNGYSLRYISGAWRSWPDSVGSGSVVDTTTSGTGLVTKTRMSHLSSYPTLNQSTTGTSAGLTSAYIDWNAVGGGDFIQNKPSTFTPSAHSQAISTVMGLQDSLSNRYRRADTANVLLSRTRAGHDYQPKGTYSTDIHSNITALNAISGTNTGDNSANSLYSGLVTFPGFGTSHSTSAYGDHAHGGVYLAIGDTSTKVASRKWVTDKNYVTGTPWTGMGYLTSLSGAWLTADTSTSLLSRTRAGHDYQPKGTYVTGTPWTGLYWTYGDTTATLETKTYNTSKLALKVPTSRTISTTSPLSGGGDMTGNRTLIINTDTLASWARRKDTATIILSRTRAGHDFQAKGNYLTTETYTGTVTSIATTSPITGGTITGSGTISINTDTLSSWRLKQNKGSTAYGWGNHASGGYVTGTPWTGMGYLTSNGLGNVVNFLQVKVADSGKTSACNYVTHKNMTDFVSGMGGGTVTSVGTISPLSGTVTASGNLSINTDSLASWARRKDTTNLLLSRVRAGHDYQPKGTYLAVSDTGALLLSRTRAGHEYQAKGSYLTAVDTTTAGTGLVNKTRMSHLSSYPTLNQNTTGTAGGVLFDLEDGYGIISFSFDGSTSSFVNVDTTNIVSKTYLSHKSSYPTLNQNTSGTSGNISLAASAGQSLRYISGAWRAWADSVGGGGSVDTTTAGSGLVNKTRMSHLSSYPTLNQATTGQSGSVANNLSNGYGINSLSFNGGSSGTVIADSTHLISTVRFGHISAYPTLNQNTTGTAASCTGAAGSVTNSLTNGYGINSLTYNGSSALSVVADSTHLISTVRFGHLSAYPTLNQSTTGTASNITGILALANGGTAANLTANTGGILYSGASAFAVLAGTATANKILCSGANAAPVWSTPTFPNSSATTRKIIVSDGTNWVASTETHAIPGTSGNLMISDGTNWTSAANPSTPTSRTISTTSPLSGGGDLTGNRTLIINTDSLASWGRRKDTANLYLSRARAGHDYQTKLVSATNIKTINSNSILGSGDLSISCVNASLMTDGHRSTVAAAAYNTVTTNAVIDSVKALYVPLTKQITIAAGVIDSLRQVTTGFNKVWCGAISYAYTIDSLIFIGYGAAISLTVKVGYGSSATAAPTTVVNAGTAVTSVTSATRVGTFDHNTPGAGSIISIWTSAITTKGAAVSVIIKGH